MAIKFKGKTVEVNGTVVATINGWRNPRGYDHVPFEVRLAGGQRIEPFSYCDDARKWCRQNEAVLAKLVDNEAFDVKGALNLL